MPREKIPITHQNRKKVLIINQNLIHLIVPNSKQLRKKYRDIRIRLMYIPKTIHEK